MNDISLNRWEMYRQQTPLRCVRQAAAQDTQTQSGSHSLSPGGTTQVYSEGASAPGRGKLGNRQPSTLGLH